MSRMYWIEVEGIGEMLVDDELYKLYVKNDNSFPDVNITYTTVAKEDKVERLAFSEDK